MNPWRWIRDREIDLMIERWIAHRFGWCTVACRGREGAPCGPDYTRDFGYEEHVRGRRWWRWTY